MPEKLHVEITDHSVGVCLNVSPKTRFYATGFFTLFTLAIICLLLFLPGKNGGSGVWQDRPTSLFFLAAFPVAIVLLQHRYVRMAYPSDETFQCDRSILKVSRVRWWDVNNSARDTWSWSLSEVSDIRFAVLARSKGAAIYGLRFTTAGGTERILPGLKPRDAKNILAALKAWGADVTEDGLLERKLKE
jgi:hypothetical protein